MARTVKPRYNELKEETQGSGYSVWAYIRLYSNVTPTILAAIGNVLQTLFSYDELFTKLLCVRAIARAQKFYDWAIWLGCS